MSGVDDHLLTSLSSLLDRLSRLARTAGRHGNRAAYGHCSLPVLQVNDDDADVVLVVPPDGEPGQERGGAEAPGLLPVASSDRSSWCSCSCSGDEGGRVGARMDPVLQIPKSLPKSPDP